MTSSGGRELKNLNFFKHLAELSVVSFKKQMLRWRGVQVASWEQGRGSGTSDKGKEGRKKS
jgi:hypothetical protein